MPEKKIPLGGLRGDSFILCPAHVRMPLWQPHMCRSGLGVRADLRSCWEWYQKLFLFYRPSHSMISAPFVHEPLLSSSYKLKLPIPAIKISPCITGTFHTCILDKEVI